MTRRRHPATFLAMTLLAALVPVVAAARADAAGPPPSAGRYVAFAAEHGGRWAPQEATFTPQADGWCAESTQTDPADVPWLDLSDVGAFLDCETGLWFFQGITYDVWPSSDLDAFLVYLDSDANGNTGCNGADHVAVAFTDGGGRLVGYMVETPSCDDSSWRITLDLHVDRTAVDDIYLVFPHWLIGAPSLLGWAQGLAPVDGAWLDRAPDESFHAISVSDPCAPSGTGWAAVSERPPPDAVSAASHRAVTDGVLSAAGLDTSPQGHGVVAFEGDPVLAARALRARGIEATIVADRAWPLAQVPNDPLYSEQWELGDVGAPSAWDTTTGSGSVTVAVLDTGVDRNHPELAGKIFGAYDATTGQALGPGNTDTIGHGTAVAGVATARTDNADDLASLGWDLRVMPVKLGDDVRTSAIVTGIRHARLSGADVINMSFGGFCPEKVIEDEIIAARADGSLPVASAGNMFLNGNPTVYPAAHPSTFAIGATTRQRTRAGYSTAGAYVDLSAPGGDDRDPITVIQPGGALADVAGTSFSAPLVAAAAGLVRSIRPGLDPDGVQDLLEVTARDLGTPGHDHSFGWGLLDAAEATRVAALVERLAGASRYGTAAAIADDGWPGGADHVFVATGTSFPDALVTGALSARRPGPLVLVAGCSLPQTSKEVLQRLSPSTITVVGGESAVCPAVVQQITQLTGASTTRIAGATRYHTAAALAGAGWSSATSLYLASGASFADGLTGGVRAGRADAPMALTKQCELPAPTSDLLDSLGVTEVVVLGGPVAVCDAVLTSLAKRGISATRLSGDTRYGTAVDIADDDWPSGGTWPVAVGTAFPDGLALGPWAVQEDRPLLLLPPCGFPTVVAQAVAPRSPDGIAVAGGPAAVCHRAAFTLGTATG